MISHLALGVIILILGVLLLVTPEPSSLAGATLTLGGLMCLVGVVSVFTGYGILKYSGWLRSVGTFTSAGYLILGILLLLASGVGLELLGALAIILSITTLTVLWLQRFKRHLGN